MANSYSQINIHVIIAVKGRERVLTQDYDEVLYKYIAGILKNHDQYTLAINGYLDHVHIFFELKPKTALADLVRVIKSNSSKWINENGFVKGKFQWQKGYAAFSYSRSQRNTVINYIKNQKEHHRKKTFKEEYLELLEKFQIDFDKKYLFEFYD